MLTKIKFALGIYKQDTAVGADALSENSDNVRFRYGLPEKFVGCLSWFFEGLVVLKKKIKNLFKG
jgi:hypothetical protein